MTATEGIRTLVSVHDVMPETLDLVQDILDRCRAINPGPLTLLVVPGLDWTPEGLAQLKTWQDQGHRLAGHGWVHRVDRFGGIAHRLHALLISRRAAEHLALDGSAITRLIARCHAWFHTQGLDPPSLYVPPAWALGALTPADLAHLPFTRYELLTGVRAAADGRLTPLPLLGYEADTGLRAIFIRLWNRINRLRARHQGWLRIGIHPRDPGLRLGADLQRDLSRFPFWVTYDALADSAGAAGQDPRVEGQCVRTRP